MCSKCNEHHDEDCCCCECCEEEKELVRDRRELTDEEIESIIVEKYNTKDEKTKVFIRKALKKQGDWYDYGKVEYKNSKTKITIGCPIHGDIRQNTSDHLQGYGCKKCADILVGNCRRKTLNQFISEATLIHNGKYNYSKVNYIDSHTDVIITCPVHGDFKQSPSDHLRGRGCRECGYERVGDCRRKTLNQFISEANEIHNSKYKYDHANYVDSHTNIMITCPIHGDFLQTPDSHLRGRGCPYCHDYIGETFISEFLFNNNIISIQHLRIESNGRIMFPDFTIGNNIWIEYNGEQHYKMQYFHKGDINNFINQLERDINKRNYCKANNIKLIEIPYIFNTYEKVADFLDKVLFQNVDPNTLVDVSKLYKLDNTGLNLVDLFPT